MKAIATLVILSIFTFHNSKAQDAMAAINASWTNLKNELQRRAGIVSNIAGILAESKQVNQDQIKNCRTFSNDLFNYIDTLRFKDSLSISRASGRNYKLTQALMKVLAAAENDVAISSNDRFMGLLVQLEGCENRIAVATKEYNTTCSKYGKTDLLFISQQQKAPEIKF